ncbi:hypothetical protein GCM10009530_28610 [Microbispora corallina]|uniref:Iron complex transport system permease protein n=1 Tax=Microbispora corallina TaxID=83302 RepID=A0ABQ4FZK7_9ACTN|nr:iron ABC transporter permease [Microbispora corallina]GIH40246.1 hypothetical protein Mco01_32460 [Microbispora corallina]
MASRRLRVLLTLGAALVVAAGLSLALGAKAVPPGDVWHALWWPGGGENDLIVRSLRVPRTVLGVLAGVALGIAGALMQGHTRNPLADPGLLGVTQGAAFAMVLGIVAFGVSGTRASIWLGVGGALAASVAVFAIGLAAGGRRGGSPPLTLALAGAAVSALLYALTSALVLLDEQAMDTFRFWQAGSLAGRGAGPAWQVAPFVAAGLVLALANARGLNALALGEDVARSLGRNVWAVRVVGLAAVTSLTAGAVAACGALAFVGLVVPHLARALSGPDHRWLLPYAGLLGAVLLLVADVIGRLVARPGELAVGVVLALLGAPFLIALVRRAAPATARSAGRARALRVRALLRPPEARPPLPRPSVRPRPRADRPEIRLPEARAYRIGGASWLVRPRPAAVALACLAALAALTAAHLGLGDVRLPLGEILRALGGDGGAHFVVVDLRLPRVLTGALVGAAFGLSGAITQAVSRNPLASPDILGVTSGAGVCVVALIVATGSAYGGVSGAVADVGVPTAAVAGGLVGAAAVHALAWRRGLDGYRLVLVGIGVAAVFTNVTHWLLTAGDVNDTARAMVWITGSLHGRGWEHVVPVAVALAVLVPVALGLSRTLAALRFGDETALALGVRLGRARAALLLVAVLLAAVATASAGPIAFVALTAPQIALRVARTPHPPLLVSALTGAVLTAAADLVARTVFAPAELPVGVVTAALGAPYLIHLLWRGSGRRAAARTLT